MLMVVLWIRVRFCVFAYRILVNRICVLTLRLGGVPLASKDRTEVSRMLSNLKYNASDKAKTEPEYKTQCANALAVYQKLKRSI